MRKFRFNVRGVTFDGRQAHIAKLTGDEPVRIIPEPDNPFDPNALGVNVAYQGKVIHIGYMPKERAKEYAPYLDGESLDGRIIEITGGFETRDGDTAALGVIVEFELPEDEAK